MGLRILPADFEPAFPADKAAGKDRQSDKARQRQLSLRPNVLRIFCNALGLPASEATKEVSDCVVAAVKQWPEMIQASPLAQRQKEKLLAYFYEHPAVQGVMRRAASPPG